MIGLDAHLLERLGAWLPPNDEAERPLMQLATIDGTGRPDVRTVLLSEWDEHGFAFHTDATSRKVRQMAAHPDVAVVVALAGRQLTAQGTVSIAGREQLDRVYSRRSPYLRRLAWLNTPETAQLSRPERVADWAHSAESSPESELRPPAGWTGYVVRPTRLTFWEADPDGPSHRTEYRAGGEAWTVQELPG